MKINEELEKALDQLEEDNSEYTISLLDVVGAIEKAYQQINGSILSDVKDFQEGNERISCVSERYAAHKGENVYAVNLGVDKTEKILNINVSPLGEISWVITSDDRQRAEEIIQELNQPDNKIMESLKMDADVSFFTQNRELVLLDNPYIALKMGNFVEGDKAVIVYKEEESQDTINKANSGIRYIRVDQIEGYLKNIKIDERKIPALAYAYLKRDFSEQIKIQKHYIEKKLHPELSDDKIEKLKCEGYSERVTEGIILGSIGGSIGGLVIGSAVLALTLSAGLIGAAIGVGIPAICGVIVYKKEMKKINFARDKDVKVKDAKIDLYKLMREYANENITKYEQEFTARRTKKKKSLKSVQDLSASEIVCELKKYLSNEDTTLAKLYDLALSQIINSYSIDEIENAEKLRNDAEFFGALIKLSEAVKEIHMITHRKNVGKALEIIKSLVQRGDNNLTIQILNKFDELLTDTALISLDDKNVLRKDLEKAYLEALVTGSYQENGLAVETIAEISSASKVALLRRLESFGKRMQNFNEEDKLKVGNSITSIYDSSGYFEIKIIKMINIIAENGFEFDLLGKVPTQKVKKQEIK